MGHGIVRLQVIDYWIICAALTGAIVWNLITWRAACPPVRHMRSSGGWWVPDSRRRGWERWCGVDLEDTCVHCRGTLLGLGLGLLMVLLAWLFRRATPRRIDRVFRRGQLLSAALYSLGHGGNDAKNGRHHLEHPRCGKYDGGHHAHSFLGAVTVPHRDGTRHGVWRMADRANHGDADHQAPPVGGFAAETAGATTLAINSVAGIPVSTTHVITGAIVGVGATMKLSSVRWGIAGRILGPGCSRFRPPLV